MAAFLCLALCVPMGGDVQGKVVREAFWLPGLARVLRDAPVVVRVQVQQDEPTVGPLTDPTQRYADRGTLTVVEVLRWVTGRTDPLKYGASWIKRDDPVDARLETKPWDFIKPKNGEEVLLIADGILDDSSPHVHRFAPGTGLGYIRIDGRDDPTLTAIREYVRLLSLPRPAGEMALQQVAAGPALAEDLLARLALAHILSNEADGLWLPGDRIQLAARYLIETHQPLSFRLQVLAGTKRWADTRLENLAPLLEAYLVLWDRVDDFVELRVEALKHLADLAPRLSQDAAWGGRFAEALQDRSKANSDRELDRSRQEILAKLR